MGIGSNLGDRKNNCLQALKMLDEDPCFKVTAVSSWHETEPEGMISDNKFINGVIEGATTLSADKVVKLFMDIENRLGRDRNKQGMDRPVDLDLLYLEDVVTGYDDSKQHDAAKEVIVPHPRLSQRVFVLEPWAELDKNLLVPVFNLTVSEMLQALIQSGNNKVA